MRKAMTEVMGILALFTIGCNGHAAGDHMYYRIGVEPASESCDPMPLDGYSSVTTARTPGVFILYFTSTEDVALQVVSINLPSSEVSGAVLPATTATPDGKYKFRSLSNDVRHPYGNATLMYGDATVMHSSVTTISMDVAGDTVSGEIDTSSGTTCTGMLCAQYNIDASYDPAPSLCTFKSSFTGIEIANLDE